MNLAENHPPFAHASLLDITVVIPGQHEHLIDRKRRSSRPYILVCPLIRELTSTGQPSKP